MDLNDIELAPAQVASLYTSSLVALGDEPATAQPPKPASDAPLSPPAASAKPAFLGQNEKGILLVNSDPNAVFIADSDLEVLTKIMDRASIGLADIAIVNWAHIKQTDGPALIEELGSKRILLFGLEPDVFGLPVRFPVFQVQRLSGLTYLCAPPVAQLATAEDAVKKNFWSAFKNWLA